eukprot:scaffold113871_cov17-Tisochrysis_lutea.AAC.4
MCQPAHACTERAGLAGMLKHTSHHCTHVNTGARVRKRMSTCASKQAHAHAHKPSTARGMKPTGEDLITGDASIALVHGSQIVTLSTTSSTGPGGHG